MDGQIDEREMSYGDWDDVVDVEIKDSKIAPVQRVIDLEFELADMRSLKNFWKILAIAFCVGFVVMAVFFWIKAGWF